MIKSLFTNPKLKKDAPEEPKAEKKTEPNNGQKPVQSNSNEPEDRMDDILRVVRKRFLA